MSRLGILFSSYRSFYSESIFNDFANHVYRGSRRAFAFGGTILVSSLCAAICVAQPSSDAIKTFQQELETRRAGMPSFGVPDESIEGQLVYGALTTPDGVVYQFTSEAGRMLYVIDKSTDAQYAYIVSPARKDNAAGESTVLPRNLAKDDDLVMQAFRLDDGGSTVVETQFTGINTKVSGNFVDSESAGGSGTAILFAGILSVEKPGQTHSLCCVSCGTYQICGQSVSSSCGSCGGPGGPGSQIKD